MTPPGGLPPPEAIVNREWHGRRCLVTGASGFIGTALCRALRAHGAVVHGAGRRTPARTEPYWHTADIAELDQVRALFAETAPEIVFHLAARVTGARSIEEVLPTLADTLESTVNVLVAAVESRCARVVTMGSLQEPDDRIHGVPPSPYAAAKLAAGAYTRMFGALYALPVTIARTFMVYGPGQLDFTKVLPYTVAEILQQHVARLSSGQQAFDWIYVDDVVEALIAMASCEAAVGATLDVGTGVLTPVRDVVERVASTLGAASLLEFGAIPDRRLEPTRCAQVERTASLIGWRPRVTLEEGLDRTVQWYREQFATGRVSQPSRSQHRQEG